MLLGCRAEAGRAAALLRPDLAGNDATCTSISDLRLLRLRNKPVCADPSPRFLSIDSTAGTTLEREGPEDE